MESDFFWMCAIIVGFIGPLIAAAALIESNAGRRWIKRLQAMQEGRARQAAEYIVANSWQGPRQ